MVDQRLLSVGLTVAEVTQINSTMKARAEKYIYLTTLFYLLLGDSDPLRLVFVAMALFPL